MYSLFKYKSNTFQIFFNMSSYWIYSQWQKENQNIALNATLYFELTQTVLDEKCNVIINWSSVIMDSNKRS